MSEENKVADEALDAVDAVASDEQIKAEAEVETESEVGAEVDLVSELTKKLALAEKTINDQKESVLRAQADMENLRRRATLDIEKAHKFALDKFADGLLPVIDSLEMAISHADKEDEALKPMVDGVELTLKSMLSTIEKFGLKMIDPQDQEFDPEKHQAMSMQAVAGVPANKVIAVMQKGYELNGRLIRPAMVMVSKAAD
ncbi:nucleotide exchange factor GrpE [Psychromonas sp. MME2]|uniref:nucleotide exchange factor GrpE n=1 Tax=unclassified Psychromonas TaxID=2614957 RepID=UPI00339BADCC